MLDTVLNHVELAQSGTDVIAEFYPKQPKKYADLLRIDTKTTDQWDLLFRGRSDMGRPVKINDGDPTPLAAPTWPFAGRIGWDIYALGRLLTHNTIKTDQYGVNSPAAIVEDLMRSHVYGENVAASNMLNFAFSTNAEWLSPVYLESLCTCVGDGGSAGHALGDGLIGENRGVGAAGSKADIAFAASSLTQACTDIGLQVSHKGEPMGLEGPYLVVTPWALRAAAVTVVNSQLLAGTPNNDMNINSDLVVGVAGLNHLDPVSRTQWFVLDVTQGNGLVKVLNEAPDHVVENKASERTVLHTSRHQFSYNHWDWRGVWGTDGTP